VALLPPAARGPTVLPVMPPLAVAPPVALLPPGLVVPPVKIAPSLLGRVPPALPEVVVPPVSSEVETPPVLGRVSPAPPEKAIPLVPPETATPPVAGHAASRIAAAHSATSASGRLLPLRQILGRQWRPLYLR